MAISSHTRIGTAVLLATAGLALTALAQSAPPVAPATPAAAKALPAKKPAATPAAAPASPITTQSTTQAQPAAPVFQTLDQLQKAGVKRCLQLAQTIGQATLAGATEYAAASTWNSKQPDNRFSVSMIGQRFGTDASAGSGLSGVFASPTAEGKCDAAAIQIIPSSDPCAKMQAQILEKGKLLGNLAGVAIFQNAAKAEVMLVPTPHNGCVLVALSTAYSE